MIKAAFFDIDGTLLSFDTHKMPPSTARALAALRERGVLTIVSSGRSYTEMGPEIATGFDAYVTFNGQLCFDKDGAFRSLPIDEADVRTIVGMAEEGAFDVLIAQEKRSFASARGPRVRAVEEHVGLTYEVDDTARAFDAPVYQFCAFVPREGERQILDATRGVAVTRWCDWFCDVVPASGGKAYGVRAALERYGLSPEEAIAFGDGENDLSMFEVVGTAVAMGNAWDSVKARADYVTDAVDADGIWNACRHFGLI